jgi:hypothetical protein
VAAAKVTSVATRRFWNLFDALPDGIQQLAVKTTSFGVATRIILRSTFADRREAPIGSAFALEITIALLAA